MIKSNAHYVFTKILIFSYNNAQIHPNVTVQYLKSISFVQKAWKTCDHTSVSDKNQSSSRSKGFILGLVQKILVTCERVANKFLHPGANYTYMYNLHTVCKSAHVNGAYVAPISFRRITNMFIKPSVYSHVPNLPLYEKVSVNYVPIQRNM